MNKTKYGLLLNNSLWGSGSFVFISIISFLILPFIIKKLSIEGYGIYILITSLVGFYGILDLGLGSALIKYVAELHEKNEIERLNLYINNTVIFQGLIGLLSSIAILFFSKNILYLLNVGKENIKDATYALNLCAIGFFFTFIGGAYRSVLQGLQLYKSTSIIDSVLNLALNTFVAVVLFMGFGLVGCIVINVIVAFISFIGYYILVKKNISSYVISFFINFKILKEIISFSFYIFLSRISGIFSTYIVRFVISFFLGPTAVTYYIVPSKLVGALGGVASGAISAIFPFSSQIGATNDTNEIKKLFLQSSRIFTAILFPVVVFISLFSSQILTIWMGKEFAQNAWVVLSVISFSSLIGSLSAIPNLIILGLGNSKLLGVFSLITIVLYIIFIPVLTKLFGINGTAVALLLTSTGVIYYVIIKTTEYIHIKAKEYYSVVLKPHIGILFIAIVLFPIVMMMKSQHIIMTISIGTVIMFLHYLYLIKLKIIPFENIYNKLFQKA